MRSMNLSIPKVSELLLLVILKIIAECVGYDRTLNLDEGDCDSYEIYELTQYQSYLIIWNGKPFDYRCLVSFHGKNDQNVETSFHVCFKTLAHYFDGCNTEIQFISGLLSDRGEKFDCNTPIPEKWCTKYHEFGKLRIESKSRTKSRLTLKVTVTADVSLTVPELLGIIFGLLAVIGIVSIACIIWCCKRNHAKPSGGRVVRTQEDLLGTEFEGQQLAGYPTEQTEMVPAGRGRYRAKKITVQHTIAVPSNVLPQVIYTSQNPPSLPTNQTDPSNNKPYSSEAVSPSAPPPTYDSCL